jgi:hypothetical protein
MEVSNDFNKLVIEKNNKKFTKIIEWTQEYFWCNAKKWQIYTDKIIFLFSRQIEFLKENIWKKINFENIYNRKILSKKVINLSDEFILFEDWTSILIDEWRVIVN